ncbi:MsnO8 family LLM class oxidoreductase [Oharaeibacter diazotrophicus]|uniref:Luciferase family oxidoreductase group 1 n=2 Tax=Oharaeibacter diazotrophicus TaxID=1920512 RepID=A0A4R6RMH9_9HYPH|nr:MsnO8 family LLM class oxidoreductase [Oharaeibacter diazotrophicus]TDP87375.1 luciferase family oxidoreductase group 1 [Oharaeibacter diazotrophicus]BBE70681.1 limonene 1,2-monooxygenase [Pleomorphomonas sp. SM30]
MRLSILDQSVTVAGQGPAAAIRETVALARAADRLGYHRFWVSEHHGFPGLAGSAPMPLLGAIAAGTRRIRLGAAAVILPHAAPLKVAEEALVLEALAPGRVDLGLGRGPGADRATAYALSPELLDDPLARPGGGFADDVAAVLAFLSGAPMPPDHPFAGVAAVPAPEGPGPAPFVVGGTARTAQLAGRLGLPYAFAHFVADGAGADDTLAAYRRTFVPSRFLAAPRVIVATFAAAAATASEAAGFHAAYRRWRAARDVGAFRPIGHPSADDATPPAGPRPERFGTADVVVSDLHALAESYGADEVVVAVPVADLGARLRAVRLIAAAAGLAAAPSRPRAIPTGVAARPSPFPTELSP